MKKRKQIYQRTKDYIRVYGQYFKEDQEEIVRSNLINLQLVNAAAIVITTILIHVAPHLIAGWHVTIHYITLLPTQAAFFLAATYGRKHPEKFSHTSVEILCALFQLGMMLSFINISVFPYPETPQLFITCCFFLIPTVLIQRLPILIFISTVSEILFLLLAFYFKTPKCFGHDAFNTIASIMFATAVLGVNIRLRIRDYDARKRFQKLSQIDQLTQLTEKITFEVICERKCLSFSENCKNALLFIDLDDFKQINDTYGHPCGDMVLQQFSQRLKETFGGNGNVLGRIGGDEFAVFLSGISGEESLFKQLEELCAKKEVTYNEEVISYTCSVGAVIHQSAQKSYKELAHQADQILYQVKDTTKNSFRIFVA